MKQQSNKIRFKKSAPIKIAIYLLILAFIAVTAFTKIYFSTAPLDKNAVETVDFIVENGAGTKRIAADLQKQGLIKRADAFTFYVKKEGLDGKLRIGHYQLSASMSVDEIADQLMKGIGETITFTIPEGYTTKDIAKALAEKNIIAEDVFWQTIETISLENYSFAANDTNDVSKRLEGYLFPDTYKIGVNSSAEQVIYAMLNRFEEVYSNLKNNSGLTMEEMVVLASLVESEAKLDKERATIASVYINRLEKKMLLQCDATVLYSLGYHKDIVTYADLEYDSPYNTYKYSGLPPTAICNPGKASLEAACNPEDTNYLYYLWSRDEEVGHVFAETGNGHARNRQKYGY